MIKVENLLIYGAVLLFTLTFYLHTWNQCNIAFHMLVGGCAQLQNAALEAGGKLVSCSMTRGPLAKRYSPFLTIVEEWFLNHCYTFINFICHIPGPSSSANRCDRQRVIEKKAAEHILSKEKELDTISGGERLFFEPLAIKHETALKSFGLLTAPLLAAVSSSLSSCLIFFPLCLLSHLLPSVD